MKTLHSVPHSYDVLLDETNGKHFLEALCGGVAAYTVSIELTDEEVAAFHDDPEHGLLALAREVQQHSGRKP